jgi:unsaturated pyranuronate lyase
MQRETDPGPASEPLGFATRWVNKEQMPHFSPMDKITMHVFSGGRAMFNIVTIEAGGTVPKHSHPHEQMGTVLDGEIHLKVGADDAEPWVLRPGDYYTIAPNVPHSATVGPNGVVALDIFAPPREDYIAQANAGANTAEGTYLAGNPST